jgi:hypothetical protein
MSGAGKDDKEKGDPPALESMPEEVSWERLGPAPLADFASDRLRLGPAPLACEAMNFFCDLNGLLFVSLWKHEDAMSVVRPLWQSCVDIWDLYNYFEVDYPKLLYARQIECFRRFQADLREEPPQHVWRALWNIRPRCIQLSQGRINVLLDLADEASGPPLWLEDYMWNSVSHNLSAQLQIIFQNSETSALFRHQRSSFQSETRNLSPRLYMHVRSAGRRLLVLATVSKKFQVQVKVYLARLRSMEAALRVFERRADANVVSDVAGVFLTFVAVDFLTERLFEDLLALSS